MKNARKKIIIALLACALAIVDRQAAFAGQLPPSEYAFTPSILIEKITDRTTRIPVYVYDNTTLYIKNRNDTVFKKFYKEKGLKYAIIKGQKGGSRLKFYLVSKESGKTGGIVSKKVAKLPAVAKEKLDEDIGRPKVQKKITSKTSHIRIAGEKGTDLVIKNEKKVLKVVQFKEDGNRQITIPKQEKGTLYFYMKKGKVRGEIVARDVIDVTAPKAPKLKADAGSLSVKGEIGTEIYLKGAKGWHHLGTMISGQWNSFLAGIDFNDVESEYYKVYLKDEAGNKSKAVRIKNPCRELPAPPCT